MRTVRDEVVRKHARAVDLMETKGVDCLLLSTAASTAWITGGAEVRVAQDTDTGPAQVLVFPDRLVLVTRNIEKDRLVEEELADFPGDVIASRWYEGTGGILRRLTSGKKVGIEREGFLPGVDLRVEIASLRYVLEPEEIARYREVGYLAAEAIEEAAGNVRPGETEREAAARLETALHVRMLEPIVTLVAADERIEAYRHPLPTAKKIEARFMLVTCARRYGLIAAATRLVSFVPLSEDIREKHRAVVKVDSELIASSRPGVSLGNLFETARKAYEEVGYPGEIELHHQGGTIGYQGREAIALPGSTITLNSNQAVAWNPSITGTKSEDTYLITENGPECLTTGNGLWPMIDVEAQGRKLRRPNILVV